jgi:hypothetical protein
VVEHLPSKHKAQSSNPSIAKKIKKRKKRKKYPISMYALSNDPSSWDRHIAVSAFFKSF